jgi:hypothetical protein
MATTTTAPQILTLPSTVSTSTKHTGDTTANTTSFAQLTSRTTVGQSESADDASSEGSGVSPSDALPPWLWIAVGAGAGALVCLIAIAIGVTMFVKRKRRAASEDDMIALSGDGGGGNGSTSNAGAASSSKSSSMYCTLPQEQSQSQYSSVFDTSRFQATEEKTPHVGLYKSSALTQPAQSDDYNVGNIE